MHTREISLNGTWQVRREPLEVGPDQAGRVSGEPDEWIPAPVPGDVRQALVAAAELPEPLLGLNSFAGHWVEEHSWWWRTTFDAPPARDPAAGVELVLDGLDVHASVFLNGVHLGDHPSAFRPFVARVEEHLAERNVLLVRLTNGLEHADAAEAEALGGVIPTEAMRGMPERGDVRRVFLRKPQYSWGWDWCPRVASVAIGGGAKLRLLAPGVLRDVNVRPRRTGRRVDLRVAVTADWLDPFRSGAGEVRVTVRDPDGSVVAREATGRVLLQSGQNELVLLPRIDRPRLWWPRGYGRQDRYTIETELVTDAGLADRCEMRYGIRFLELRADPAPPEGGKGWFALRVNGREVFCRGANWVPADAIYARVTDEKVRRLVAEAAAANFTMLRIWGGGLYERDAFYDACEREGLLVWQDFMLACAPYPDHLETFRDEVAREADYQTRRLASRCCIALWCGSNENLQFLETGRERETRAGTRLLGEVLPEAVRRNAPDVPYWYTSPYGGEHCDALNVGDVHYWHELMMHPEMERRITPEHYDACDALFVSEYGYVGPCCEETTRTYLDGAEFDRSGRTWQHHNNAFEADTVDAGIAKHYTDPRALAPREYLLYGGLVQGLMLGYSLEALRARADCNGAMFWMYNDCWGEVGWSVIDYDLRRKISWYFVRRALEPRRLILRREGNEARVTLANDTSGPVRGTLEYGYVSLDGRERQVERMRFAAPPASRTVLTRFDCTGRDNRAGLWFARTSSREIAPASLRTCAFRELRTVAPRLSVRVVDVPGGVGKTACCAIRVRSREYAHAVHVVLPEGFAPIDAYFDLLPGESRTVPILGPGPLELRNVEVRSVWRGGVGSSQA